MRERESESQCKIVIIHISMLVQQLSSCFLHKYVCVQPCEEINLCGTQHFWQTEDLWRWMEHSAHVLSNLESVALSLLILLSIEGPVCVCVRLAF